MNELVERQPAQQPMAAAVLHRAPQVNTARLISSLQQCGCKPVVKRRTLFPNDPQTGQSMGWRERIDGVSVEMSADVDLQLAGKIVLASVAPADIADVHRFLAELSLVTAMPSRAGGIAELTITAYAKRLISYPGDIVRDVLEGWSGKWFPTWVELKEVLDTLAAERRMIVDAVMAKIVLGQHQHAQPR